MKKSLLLGAFALLAAAACVTQGVAADWKPVDGILLSKFAKDVDPAQPLKTFRTTGEQLPSVRLVPYVPQHLVRGRRECTPKGNRKLHGTERSGKVAAIRSHRFHNLPPECIRFSGICPLSIHHTTNLKV